MVQGEIGPLKPNSFRIVWRTLSAVLGWAITSVAYAVDSIPVPTPGIDAAIAADNWDMAAVKNQLFTPVPEDLSLDFLAQLFGNVHHILQGQGGSLLAEAFKILNLGLFTIAASAVAYITFRSVVNTANSGAFLGQKMSFFVPARVLTGTALLFPKFGGYSLIQIFVMWVVVHSVGLADFVWTTTVDFLEQGGVFYQVPLHQDNAVSANKAAFMASAIQDASQIFGSGLCAKSLHVLQNQARAARGETSQPFGPRNAYTVMFAEGKLSFGPNGVCGSYYWPTVGNPQQQQAALQAFSDALLLSAERLYDAIDRERDPNEWLQHDCFTKENIATGRTCPSANDIAMAARIYMETRLLIQAAAQQAQATQPVQTAFEAADAPADTLVKPTWFAGLFSSFDSAPERATLHQAEASKPYYAEAKRHGWILAARYYRRLVDMKGLVAAAQNQPALQVGTGDEAPPTAGRQLSSALNDYLRGGEWQAQVKARLELGLVLLDNKDPSVKQTLRRQAERIAQISRDSDRAQLTADIDASYMKSSLLTEEASRIAGFPADNGQLGLDSRQKDDMLRLRKVMEKLRLEGDYGAGLIGGHIEELSNSVMNAWTNQFLGGGDFTSPDPLLRLQQLGKTLLIAGINFIQDVQARVLGFLVGYGIATQGVATAGALVMSGIFPSIQFTYGDVALEAGNAIISGLYMAYQLTIYFVFALLPLGLAIAVPILLLGLMMAVYAPLIPYLLFTFATIGWFIAVLEAMIASPIIALGLAHPQGHDILGRAEVGLMLILGVFMRPIAMLLGFIIGIMLSYVGLELLNYGFVGIFLDAFANFDVSGLVSPAMTKLVVLMGMMIIYVFFVLGVLNQSYALIYILPDKLLRWIGGQAEHSTVGQALEQVKGKTDQSGQQIGQGAGDTPSSTLQSGLRPSGGLQLQQGESKKDDKVGGKTK